MIARLSIMVSALCLPLLGCNRPGASPPAPPGPDMHVDDHPQVGIGMTKQQVTRILGQPARTQTFVKRDEPIFGLIEGWWDDLAEGDEVEIWLFPQQDGNWEIYFFRGSDAVSHTGFVPKGVVF